MTASMAVCQTFAVWTKHMVWDPGSILTDFFISHHLELLPVAVCYCIDGLVDTLCQINRMSLLSVHMLMILLLKWWSVVL